MMCAHEALTLSRHRLFCARTAGRDLEREIRLHYPHVQGVVDCPSGPAVHAFAAACLCENAIVLRVCHWPYRDATETESHEATK